MTVVLIADQSLPPSLEYCHTPLPAVSEMLVTAMPSVSPSASLDCPLIRLATAALVPVESFSGIAGKLLAPVRIGAASPVTVTTVPESVI